MLIDLDLKVSLKLINLSHPPAILMEYRSTLYISDEEAPAAGEGETGPEEPAAGEADPETSEEPPPEETVTEEGV